MVKTLRFREPRYIGDPLNAVRIFNEKEVDELILLDIDATRTGRGPDYRLIEQLASECFMPLCYGGGIKTLEQARRVFSLGVEKVCIHTALLENLHLVGEIANQHGRQSVVAAVDVKKGLLGGYHTHCSSIGRTARKPWTTLMSDAVAAGAGEVMITAIDRDGTQAGMDLALIRVAAKRCPVPLIANGGAAGLVDLRAAMQAGATAVAAGALFVFHGPHRAVLITYPSHAELRLVTGKLDV